MRKPSTKPTESKCPACDGTGYPVVKQPVQPGRKIYPAPCKKCGGKGRIKDAAKPSALICWVNNRCYALEALHYPASVHDRGERCWGPCQQVLHRLTNNSQILDLWNALSIS